MRGEIAILRHTPSVAPEDRWLEADADVLEILNGRRPLPSMSHICFEGAMLCHHGEAQKILEFMDRELHPVYFIREEKGPK